MVSSWECTAAVQQQLQAGRELAHAYTAYPALFRLPGRKCWFCCRLCLWRVGLVLAEGP